MSISPGSFTSGSDPAWRPEPSSDRSKGFTVVILVALVLLIGATVYLFVELRATRQTVEQANLKIQTHEEHIAKLEGSVIRTTKQVEETSSATSALKGEVSSTRGQIAQATKQVESKVLSTTQEIAQKLAAEQKAGIAKVGGEVEQLKATTESKFGAVSTEVGSVKSDVSQTKDQLQKTIAELKSVRGDLGVQSGLVATNGSELAALKRLGERNYFEFDIKKTKQAQRIGGAVSLKLKNTDTKRNRYTVEVMADDKVTEKKDRSLNEPVQFYVAKARIPYEIVVNQVAKDRIVGYLATPKDQQAR